MAGARRLATAPREASAAVIVERAPQGQWHLLCSQNHQRGASADAGDGPRGRKYTQTGCFLEGTPEKVYPNPTTRDAS